jgi:hypothetical protein
MYTFSFNGYLTIAIVLILCLIALMFFRRKINRQITAQTNLPYKKYGFSCIVLGVIVLLASVIEYLKVQADIIESPQILQSVSSMTSEPVLLLLVSGFLLGLTTIIIGVFYLRLSSSLRGV